MEILRLILNLNGVISPIDELGFTWLTEKKQKINSDKIQFSQPYAFWFFSGLRQWWTHRNLHYHSKVFNVRFKGFAFQHPFFLIRTQASFYLLAHFFCSPKRNGRKKRAPLRGAFFRNRTVEPLSADFDSSVRNWYSASPNVLGVRFFELILSVILSTPDSIYSSVFSMTVYN